VKKTLDPCLGPSRRMISKLFTWTNNSDPKTAQTAGILALRPIASCTGAKGELRSPAGSGRFYVAVLREVANLCV